MAEHSNIPTGVVICPLRADHLDDLTKIESVSFSKPWSHSALAEELQNPLAVFYVAEDEISKHAVGYLGMFHILDEADFTNITVLTDYRRKGIASALINKAIEYARNHKLKRITLEVRVSNAPAISLYERYHFVKDGIRPNFYDSPKEDAAIYSLYFNE